METTLVKTFENSDFGKVRVIMIDNEPWFVGKDVCEVLGYSNSKDTIVKHIDAEDKQILQRSQNATLEIDIPNRGLTIINESGLYSLILSSKLPDAKKFKRWVTSEVLPSIRTTGSYGTATYVIIPKFFRGNQVLTIKDVAALLNMTRSMIEGVINKPAANLHEGTDYLRLKGEKRAEFKRENPSIASCVHHIIAILESGFSKICSYFQVKDIPQVFASKVKEMSLAVQDTTSQYATPAIQTIKCILDTQKSIEEYTNLRIMLCRDYEELRREAQNDEDGEAIYGSFLDSMTTMIDFVGAILTAKILKLKDLHI